MFEFIINVSEIEELQTIENIDALNIIFSKAERTVIGGGIVTLVRKTPDGKSSKFDEFSTEADLAEYKKAVYKYLG
jgi:hypothetical protein